LTDAGADRGRALALGASATLLYLLTAPAVVNLDGLGYLKLLPHDFAAGHLLYMPVLRFATRVCGGDGPAAGRLVNALLGGTGIVLTYGIVRRLVKDEAGRFAATFAAAGLALSYGYWSQGNDVEAYAAATVSLLSTVRLCLAYRAQPTLGRALAVGVLLGVSVLCHLTHVLVTPFVAAWLASRGRTRRAGRVHAAIAVAVGGALALDVYAYAAFAVRGHDLAGAITWVRTAAHGFSYGGGPYKLADAIYGLAKSLVWSPYLYEADAQRLLGQFLLGLAPLVALAGLAIAHRRQPLPIEWRLGLIWIGPYVILGVAFFGSDSERWLFVLPALWLVAATLVARLRSRARVAAVVLAYLAVLNLATAILPARRDTWTRTRAERIGRALHDGDLLVFPGHSWDEYVSWYAPVKIEPFPISYYAARDGVEACFARLAKEAQKAGSGHVYAIRVFDERDDDPRGFDQLEPVGLGRAHLRERLGAGCQITRVPVDGVVLDRLDCATQER
jgi:hypothetical protein